MKMSAPNDVNIALTNYQKQIENIINCVSHACVYSYPAGKGGSYILIASPADVIDPTPKVSQTVLRIKRAKQTLFLRAYQSIRIDNSQQSTRITTDKYYYSLWTDFNHNPLIEWHSHPRKNNSFKSHLHIPKSLFLIGHELPGKHIPTGRVPLEDIIRFLINELRATPRIEGWKNVLDKSEDIFNSNKTW
jgi:hypothetical protein